MFSYKSMTLMFHEHKRKLWKNWWSKLKESFFLNIISFLFCFNRSLPLPINLQLYRRSTTTVATPSSLIKIDKIVLNSVDQHEPLNRVLFSQPEKMTNSKIPLNLDYQQSLLMSPINHRKMSEQSDGSESGVGSESNPYSDQENRLVSFFFCCCSYWIRFSFSIGNNLSIVRTWSSTFNRHSKRIHQSNRTRRSILFTTIETLSYLIEWTRKIVSKYRKNLSYFTLSTQSFANISRSNNLHSYR